MKYLTIIFLLGAIIAFKSMDSTVYAQSNYEQFMEKGTYQFAVDSVTEEWVRHYGSDSIAEATSIAVDALGNIYVTGWKESLGIFSDYATIKYNRLGMQRWVSLYNGPGDYIDKTTAISIDASGNVYVTGYSADSNNTFDYATVKYDSSGTEQWVARYSGPGYYPDEATAMVIDVSGNVYVTGRSYEGSQYEYATIKYNSLGIEQWVARYNGTGNFEHAATSIGIDALSNVYVTGRSWGLDTDYDYATIKYDSTGVEKWVVRYNGPGNSRDQATAIAVDISGNIYVTGRSWGMDTDYDYATIKYNSSGIEQWVARYAGLANSNAEATDIAIDASGNVYVTGHNYDYATIKYNSSGTEQWVARYDGPANDNDKATALAVDPFGNVYVTGYSPALGPHSDYATIKYNSYGIEQWVARYDGPANSHDVAAAIAIDALDNVYVTGYSSSSDPGNIWCVYTTIKYKQTPTSVEDNQEPAQPSFALDQNFPNPFNPQTTLYYNIPKTSFVSLKIFNVQGQLVGTLVDDIKLPGNYQVIWDGKNNDGVSQASGIYFYQLKAGDQFVETKRMLLLK